MSTKTCVTGNKLVLHKALRMCSSRRTTVLPVERGLAAVGTLERVGRGRVVRVDDDLAAVDDDVEVIAG